MISRKQILFSMLLLCLGFWSLQKLLQYDMVYSGFRFPALKFIKFESGGLLTTPALIQDALLN
jgi:hypothetical protein